MIDFTDKSKWHEITHELPPDVPRLWQHTQDSEYFSGDGGLTWFTVDVIPEIKLPSTPTEKTDE